MISIHQPEHMPWMGFFDKMSKVDDFIILDNVQFRKNYFQNRNRIKALNGKSDWLTVPVQKSSLSTEIRNIKLLEKNNWRINYLNKVKASYFRSRNFDYFFPQLSEIISCPNNNLIDLNLQIINWIKKILNINTRLILSSVIINKQPEQDVLIQIINALNAKTYLSGPFGRNYLDFKLYHSHKIKVVFHSYENPSYMCADDGENLSSLHYLFEYLSI